MPIFRGKPVKRYSSAPPVHTSDGAVEDEDGNVALPGVFAPLPKDYDKDSSTKKEEGK